MINREKKLKKYTKAVKRRLNLPSDVKKRVMTDFESAIQSRKEAGKTDDEIFAELGTPAQVSADLNEQMKEYAYIKSPWRWACFVLIVLCVLNLLHKGYVGLLAALLSFSLYNENVGIVGGADGPTAIFVGAPTPKLHAVCSSLHFEPVGEVEWRAVFSEKLMDDLDVCLI